MGDSFWVTVQLQGGKFQIFDLYAGRIISGIARSGFQWRRGEESRLWVSETFGLSFRGWWWKYFHRTKRRWPFGREGSPLGISGQTQGNGMSGEKHTEGDWTPRVWYHRFGPEKYLWARSVIRRGQIHTSDLQLNNIYQPRVCDPVWQEERGKDFLLSLWIWIWVPWSNGYPQ